MRSQAQSSSRSESVTGLRLSSRAPAPCRTNSWTAPSNSASPTSRPSRTRSPRSRASRSSRARSTRRCRRARAAPRRCSRRCWPRSGCAARGRGAARGLAILCDDDESAREVADEAALVRAAVARSAFVPSRGVAYGSGLEPAPHLVGERARGLGLLRARRPRRDLGGRARSSACRRPTRRATALHVERGGELVRDDAVAALVAAGYTRVERVGDRGELAVRGDILDVFPTTGAEPVRIELFGDEVERISRFSVFTQRSLAELQRSDLQPAREARRSPADVEEWTHEEDVPVPGDLVNLAPELIAHGVICAWQPERVLEGARERLEEAAASHSKAGARARLRQRVGRRRAARGRHGARSARRRRAVRGAAARAGRPRHQRGRGRAARARALGPARGRRVPAPRRRRAHAARAAPRRGRAARARAAAARRGRRQLRRLAAAPRRGVAGRARRRRLGPAAVPAPRRGRGGRRAPRPRALERRRPAPGRLRRPRGARRRALPRLRHEDGRRRHARLRQPPVQGRGPALRPARPAGEALALHRRRRPPAGALEARRQGLAHAALARPRRGARAGRRAAAPLRRAPDAHAAAPTRTRRAGSSGSSAPSRTPRPRIRRARSTRSSRISPASSRWTG